MASDYEEVHSRHKHQLLASNSEVCATYDNDDDIESNVVDNSFVPEYGHHSTLSMNCGSGQDKRINATTKKENGTWSSFLGLVAPASTTTSPSSSSIRTPLPYRNELPSVVSSH